MSAKTLHLDFATTKHFTKVPHAQPQGEMFPMAAASQVVS